jgi:hypothetical protein
MSAYLNLTVFDPSSELHASDQILVPAAVWESFDRVHEGHGPFFVEVGDADSGIMGRLRPAVPADGLPADACRLPEWMWMRLGAPTGSDDDCWIGLTSRGLPMAGSVTLRARREATLTGSADPVAMLTEALSGSGGGPSWSCLCAGAALPLACGEFDIMEITSVEGFPVPAACILDCDVNLELVPALDHVPPRPPTPTPPEPELLDMNTMMTLPPPAPPGRGSKGYVPFGGTGRRLCD